jgi:hypothetical protein
MNEEEAKAHWGLLRQEKKKSDSLVTVSSWLRSV